MSLKGITEDNDDDDDDDDDTRTLKIFLYKGKLFYSLSIRAGRSKAQKSHISLITIVMAHGVKTCKYETHYSVH